MPKPCFKYRGQTLKSFCQLDDSFSVKCGLMARVQYVISRAIFAAVRQAIDYLNSALQTKTPNASGIRAGTYPCCTFTLAQLAYLLKDFYADINPDQTTSTG